MSMTHSPIREGEVLAGKYRVERVLGMGGMGVVVAATHLDLHEMRAIKFMLPSALENAEAVERFMREARAAARLRSEHVAKVHDVGHLENGSPYMVMEYLSGSDLGSVLKQRGPLPAHEAALYAIQVCSALAEAHSSGVIHRDLKPANLFLTQRPDGTPCVKVLDFGISKVTGAGSDFEMTKTHAVLGSPQYMSPEQMRSSRNVDARTDIWSLGVILYKLVTGKAPFRGQNITELISAVLEGAPPAPSQLRPGLPVGLDETIARCLARKPEGRYANVNELAAALMPFAPAGAGAAVDPMVRLLASVAPETRARLDSVLTTAATPSVPSLPVGQGGTSSPLASTPSPGVTSLQSQVAEPTGASWGKTSSARAGRPRLMLALAGLLGVAGLLALVLVIRAVLGRGEAPADAEVAQAVSVPSAATVVASALPSVTAAPPVVEPAPPRPTAIVEPVVTATPKATATVRPNTPAPKQTPAVAAPKAPAGSKSDPFGSGRK